MLRAWIRDVVEYSSRIDLDEINLTKEEKLLDDQENTIGFLRSAAFSPKFKKVVGIAMIKLKYCNETQKFKLNVKNKSVSGTVCSLPIL